MNRPIGVTLLAAGAGIVGIFDLWRAAVFMGWVNWTFVGKSASFPDPQWGQVVWSLILAAIWFWVAAGFWNVRAYAWSFGNFIAFFTLIFGFFAILGSATLEEEFVGMFLALVIFMYLNYPGVQQHFVEHEMSLMTPEQRAAVAQMQTAQAAMAAATRPGATPPPTTPPAG